MNRQLFIQVSEGVLFFVAATCLALIVLSSVYDLRAISRRRKLELEAKRLQKSRQPWVTILLQGNDDFSATLACLGSISQSHYENYDIVVVDNGILYSARRKVNGYIHTHPQVPLRYSRKGKISSHLEALRHSYEKSQKGDIIFVIDASSTISPSLIKNSVARFVVDPKLVSLRLNEHDEETGSLLQFLRRLRWMSVCLLSKSTSLVSLYRVPLGSSGVLYRRSGFMNANSHRMLAAYYEGSIGISVVRPGGVSKTGSLLGARVVRLVLLVSVIFFITFFLYVTAVLQDTNLLMLSWMITVVWLLVAIWSDEVSPRREKIALSFSTPSFYFLVYAQLIVEGAMSTARTIFRKLPNHWWASRANDRLSERTL